MKMTRRRYGLRLKDIDIVRTGRWLASGSNCAIAASIPAFLLIGEMNWLRIQKRHHLLVKISR